jgi:hypothetical protein
MIQKILKVRADFIVGLVVLAASILAAILIHRQPYVPTCLHAPCRAAHFNYSVSFRLGVLAAGLLAAGAVIAVGTFMRRHVGDSFCATDESPPAF